jgi:RimJ/RimL family protein N-acetyltransferase
MASRSIAAKIPIVSLSVMLDARSDGVVTIREPTARDRAAFLAGRDAQWELWLGPGSDDPRPTASIVVDGTVVGWVDYDDDGEWLAPGEVNLGYNVFAPYRRRGYASRAVELLIGYLGECTEVQTATLSIDPDNTASLRVAARTNFAPRPTERPVRFFTRAVTLSPAPPRSVP